MLKAAAQQFRRIDCTAGLRIPTQHYSRQTTPGAGGGASIIVARGADEAGLEPVRPAIALQQQIVGIIDPVDKLALFVALLRHQAGGGKPVAVARMIAVQGQQQNAEVTGRDHLSCIVQSVRIGKGAAGHAQSARFGVGHRSKAVHRATHMLSQGDGNVVC